MKKIKDFLFMDLNFINTYVIVAFVFVILCIVGYFSYAYFTFEAITSGNIKIVSSYQNQNPTLLSKIMQDLVTDGSSEYGLFSTTSTNSGNPSYYYKGTDVNNYVSFAGLTWRIIRINEGDNSIRIMLDNNILDGPFSSNGDALTYYSLGIGVDDSAATNLFNWFDQTLDDYYQNEVIVDSIFCEQVKLPFDTMTSDTLALSSQSSSYTPSFMCEEDENGLGEFSGTVGLITIDEALYSGAVFYDGSSSGDTFLQTVSMNNQRMWTVNTGLNEYNWLFDFSSATLAGAPANYSIVDQHPVISLSSSVLVKANGDGSYDNPYTVITG